MEHHKIGQRLREFLKNKKLTKTDENHIKSLIDQLLNPRRVLKL